MTEERELIYRIRYVSLFPCDTAAETAPGDREPM